MLEIIGYIVSLFIGVSLGLIGGGGSILTVPVLVYLFGISPLMATSYSLFIVGVTSLVGASNSYRKGLVNFRTALLFGVTSIITVFITRKLIIPAIPEVFTIAGYIISFAVVTMLLFAALMLLASISMIKGRKEAEADGVQYKGFLLLAFYGILIGLITGFLGAGGGFLLIPALVLLLRMPMKTAVGTSLLIIALNSLIGFLADIGHYTTDWTLLLIVSAIAIAGVFIGGLLSRHIEGSKLRVAFGWFVLLMAIYILLRELVF
jgi:uncharacterized membrane protein YfcA